MYFHCVEDLENILLDSKLSCLNQKCMYCMYVCMYVCIIENILFGSKLVCLN